MEYVPDAIGATLLVPKLVGAYEHELNRSIESCIDEGYDTVVNVGAAEGYYAVGLARRLPAATIYAVDVDPAARWLCGKMADANNVADRVVIEDGLSFDAIAQIPDSRLLLIVDCEGCERDLLEPDLHPVLRNATIIVELHEFIHPGVTELLLQRFSQSHEVEVIESQPRVPVDYPELDALPERDRELAVAESRPGPMEWAVLIPLPSRHRS